ncbi:MAG: hypothetical protein KF779_08990 [Hyphomonadaceae bacterium]|nr:hypothetical protein [Hyphomonadaceae bacterium]
MAFHFVPNGKDERDGHVKGFAAPNKHPGGPDGHVFFQFGFYTTLHEHGVFYVDLSEKGSDGIVSLLTGAFVRKQGVRIAFHYRDKPAIPEISPGGIVDTARLLG